MENTVMSSALMISTRKLREQAEIRILSTQNEKAR